MKKLTLITAISFAMGIGLAQAGGDLPGAAPDTTGESRINETPADQTSSGAGAGLSGQSGAADQSGMAEQDTGSNVTEDTSSGAVGGAAVSTDTTESTATESLATESPDQSNMQQNTASRDTSSQNMQSVAALSFIELDVNRDGKIDPTEADRYRGLNRAFDRSDLNRTGAIELNEFHAYQNGFTGGAPVEASLAAAEFEPDTEDSLNRNVTSSRSGSSEMESSSSVSGTTGSSDMGSSSASSGSAGAGSSSVSSDTQSLDVWESGDTLRARYQSLDVNRDGKIDTTESDRSSRLTQAYDRFDANRTGAIELHEFSAFEADSSVTSH